MRHHKIVYRIVCSLVIVCAAIILFGFLAGCDEDDGPAEGEEFGEISGTITFAGTWPSTGDVQVSIWSRLSEDGQPFMAPDGKTEPLARPEGNTIAYKIQELSKGTYLAVTLGWRDPNNPMAGGKVLGVYWAQADSVGVDSEGLIAVTPTPIEISDDKLVWSNIDIKANLDIVP